MKQQLLLLISFLILNSPFLIDGVKAQWSTNPAINNLVSTNSGYSDPQMISDGAGGAIITYEIAVGGIYAQRISSSGTVQWGASGVAVSNATYSLETPKLTSDGAGGAIIIWIDNRNSSGGNVDIYAQRINSSGVAQWTSDGVGICTFYGPESVPQLISDGAGGAIITWQDPRNADNIYAQRINSSGVVQWIADGVAVCDATLYQKSPQLISDGAGGAIITWWDNRGGANYDIYAQRINSLGIAQWTLNGVPICTAQVNQSYPQLTADGLGGAIIAWSDNRNGASDVYVQRINSSGVIQFATNGVAVCTAPGNQLAVQLTSDDAGGAVITWNDTRSGTDDDVYAQRVNSNGIVQWAANGVAVSTETDNQTGSQLISDDAGGAIFTWYDERSGSYDIYAQRLNNSGVGQWTTDGVAICTAAGNQSLPRLISDGAGGAFITWNSNGRAQNVCADGVLGPCTITDIEVQNETSDEVSVYPNPSNGIFRIDEADIAEYHVFDALGKLLFSNTNAASNQVIDITGKPSGIYILQLLTEKGWATQKLVKQ